MAHAGRSTSQRAGEDVTDPVALSLRASINDDDTAFRDLQKTDRYDLFNVKTLDIWEDESACRLLHRAYPLSRRLPDTLFEGDHPDAAGHEHLALRLLITHPVLSSDYQAYRHNFDEEDKRQINYLPFTPDAIEELLNNYHLPRDWPWLRLNAREVGNFTRKTEWDFNVSPPRARGMGFVIHFPFVLRPAKLEDYKTEMKGKVPADRRTGRSDYNPLRDDPFIWSLAMSHSLSDGRTRGILDGITDQAYADISRRLLEHEGPWYEHPLHVPCILLDIFFEHAAWEINRMCDNVAKFEVTSRDALVSDLDKYDLITSELSFIRRNLSFQQNLAKFLLETLKFLEERIFIRQNEQEPSLYLQHLYETNPRREERLNNVLHLIENNIETSAYLQARTKDALEYINGAIRFRDNEASQADAESNKTMTFLQMAFLPATAVAAIMSMSAFDFSHNPPTVQPSFWVFWVAAIILTIVVLIAFYGFTTYKRKREEEKLQEIRARAQASSSDSSSSGSQRDDRDEKADGYRSSGSGGDVSPSKRRRRRRSRPDGRDRPSRRVKPAEAPV